MNGQGMKTLIDPTISKGGQSTTYQAHFEYCQHKIRVTIKSDSVRSQSYARVAVFDITNNQWNNVYNIHYSQMETGESMKYSSSWDNPREYIHDQRTLLKAVRAILG